MTTLTPADTILERCDNYPDDLCGLPQFVCWRNEPKGNGDFTKIPYQPDHPGSKARVNDPRTWSTLSAALDAFADSLAAPRPFTGVGFVFTSDDPFTGIDLDDCADGDTIHPAAMQIVRDFGGYAEISPSMTGLKLWTRATIPASLNVKTGWTRSGMPWGGQIEIYDRGRWFALTGWKVTP